MLHLCSDWRVCRDVGIGGLPTTKDRFTSYAGGINAGEAREKREGAVKLLIGIIAANKHRDYAHHGGNTRPHHTLPIGQLLGSLMAKNQGRGICSSSITG